MRLLGILLAVLPTIVGVCDGQQTANGTMPVIDFSKLPACGLTCLATTGPQAGCSLTDVECICTSKKMTDLTMKCVLKGCTTVDAFTLVRAQADICQYGNESRTSQLRTTTLTFGIMTKFVIPLRIGLRLASQGKLGWDDWLILVAMASDTAAFYAILRLINEGFGEHIWNVDPADLTDILFWFYLVLVFYVITNGVIKLSILAFYLRIFSISRRFVVLCWINIAFCTALIICFVFVIVFQCTPVANAWQLAPDGYCINFNAATWSYSSVNVFQDVLVIVLPIMEIIALQMSLRKKIGVILIFVMGGFVIVASTVRLSTLPQFGRTSDPTWTNQPTAMWSAIELGVGLICASIPGIYSGLRHVWPAFRAFTRKHISMDNSKPTGDGGTAGSQHKKQASTSGFPAKAKYHRASWDLPVTMSTFNDEGYEMEMKGEGEQKKGDGERKELMEQKTGELRKVEEGRVVRAGKPLMVASLDKPWPPLPKSSVIEASTTITVIRGPRSG